jgi:hypothetical protein
MTHDRFARSRLHPSRENMDALFDIIVDAVEKGKIFFLFFLFAPKNYLQGSVISLKVHLF